MQVNPSNLLNTWINDIPSFESDPAVNIYYDEKCGYGLQLKNYVKGRASEKPVLTVPSHLVLCASRIKELAKSDTTLNSWIQVDNCTGVNLLHRGMLYYWLKAENSEWKDYLHSLPTKIDLPFSYNIRKMECLHFSAVSLSHASMSKRLEIERLYERFVASDVIKSNSISLEEWLLPYQWISSRGLKHPIRDETCIVPLIDLCNHSSKKKNSRYDLDEKGNFQLLLLPTDLPAPRGVSTSAETFDLLIDYGTRSSGEFMFNYGFVPDDRTLDDFDEIVRFFDPSCEHIRNILDPGRAIADATADERYAWSLAYDVLLEFFSKNMPQALRIVVLPKSVESNDQNRFRFHNHFIMALASDEYLELVSDDDKDVLYLNDTKLHPNRVFEAVQALKDKTVLQKAREIVAKLCRLFYSEVSRVDSDAAISKLAMVEASIYKRYAEVIESKATQSHSVDTKNISNEPESRARPASSISNCLEES